jgi:hypothetical protein
MTPAAVISSKDLSSALTALVVNDSVQDVLEWLQTPPNVVEVHRLEWSPPSAADRRLLRDEETYLRDEGTRLEIRSVPERLVRRRERPSKDSAESADIEAAIADIAQDAVVPYARSPVDLTSLSELLHTAQDFSAWLVTPRSNPFFLLDLPVGYLLVRAVQGVGQGVRRGLSEGVHYRLLQLFKVPDNWRP